MSSEKLARSDYEHIYVSPHLDDAVLSCGGRIASQRERAERVLVVTAFSGSEEEAPRAGGLFTAFSDMAGRREEDRRALAALGADHLWLGYEEAVQRDRRYRSLVGLVSRIAPSDSALMEELRGRLRRIAASCPAATFYFPLAAGGHVDHQIVYQVRPEISPGRCSYYEEIPYAFVPNVLRARMNAAGMAPAVGENARDFSRAVPVAAMARETCGALLEVPLVRENIPRPLRPVLYLCILAFIMGRVKTSGPRSRRNERRCVSAELHDISAHAAAKTKAAYAYESQMPLLFDGAQAFIAAMRRYSRRIGGEETGPRIFERYWRETACG